MLVGIQVGGLFFGLIMLYLSHLYYRRGELGLLDFSLWFTIWIAYLYAVLFPQTLDILLQTLGVQGAMHLFTITGFMLAFAVIFNLYRTTKKMQQKMEKLVTTLAQEKK